VPSPRADTATLLTTIRRPPPAAGRHLPAHQGRPPPPRPPGLVGRPAPHRPDRSGRRRHAALHEDLTGRLVTPASRGHDSGRAFPRFLQTWITLVDTTR